MLNSINISHIFVFDQDKALDFYVGKLGLEVSNDLDLGVMRWLTVRVQATRPATSCSRWPALREWTRSRRGRFVGSLARAPAVSPPDSRPTTPGRHATRSRRKAWRSPTT